MKKFKNIKFYVTAFVFIFILVIQIFTNAYANSQKPIQAKVKYNEATARIEAFKDVQRKIDRNIFSEFLKDKDKKENLELIKNKEFIVAAKRQLCPFYIKDNLISYSIIYFDKPDMVFYYNIMGNLIKFEMTPINKTKDEGVLNYPKKTLGYTKFGNLQSINFETDKDEQFVYDENGKLIAHWLGNKMIKNDTANKFLNMFEIERGIIDKDEP